MSRVAINPKLILWARERSGQDEDALVERFPKLPQWQRGEVQPTFKQLEEFAKATLTPFGAFFLAEPPQEKPANNSRDTNTYNHIEIDGLTGRAKLDRRSL